MNSVAKESSYPLSPLQQGILFHSLYEPDSGLYIQQLVCSIHEELNVTAFLSAWERLFIRHSTLRTSFRWARADGPVQEVQATVDLPFEQQDWRDKDRDEQEALLAAYLIADRERAFQLDEAPLMRFALLRLANDEYRFIWTSHHALFDGRSRLLLLREVSTFYEAGAQDPVLPFVREYRDYVDWLGRQDLSPAESFWREELQDLDTPTSLRGRATSFQNVPKTRGEQRLSFTPDESSFLQAFAREHELTLNGLLQGAWALLLSRYTCHADVLFGTTRSCRRSIPGGAESMIGLIINTIPLRVVVPGSAELLDWLKELRAKHIALREYEHTPLIKIQEWSEVEKGSPLFESLVVFENYQLGEVLQAETSLWRNTEFQLVEQANYPLSVIGYGGRRLLLKLDYDRQQFDEATIAQLLDHLRTLLLAFAGNPHRKLREIDLLTAAERRELLVEWNHTAVDYGQPNCVHELFAEQARRTPDAVAVRSEVAELTYSQLDLKANQLAHYLRAAGVGPEQFVPVCAGRSVEMVIALLGVIKTGAAYVPVDPEAPRERIELILKETGAALVLTQSQLVPLFSGCSIAVVNLDDAELYVQNGEVLEVDVTPENVVYAIYTSGSTGRPKGVMIEHRGLRNLCEAQIRAFDLKPGRQELQFASLTFDASVSEVFTALVSGATLHLAAAESFTTGWSLLELLRERGITTVTLPPSLLAVLPDADLPFLHTVISAGEACSREVAARWSANHRFLNAYGPTEVSVCATIAECDGARLPPLGNPINNAQVYVLDADLNPTPRGVPGELCVAGAGLARGYLQSPELTAARFVPNPFSDAPGARLYKTGDLARVSFDGEVEYVGRVDHQIKVRGFRIEPAEVEAVLNEHPAVRDSLVLLREDRPSDKRLIAYCVVDKEVSPASLQLRDFLKTRLPAYMLPAAFVTLDAFPQTRNGKVDRRALPSPDATRPRHTDFVAPRTPLEETIAAIWMELLGVERVGVHDNFLELGGHSLLAMQVASRLREAMGVELPLRAFLDDATVAALAQRLETTRASAESASPIVKFTREEPPLASFAQQRLWLLEQLDSGNSAYNITKFLRLTGPLDIAALESALTELVARHESLRTTFAGSNGEPRQIIAPAEKFTLAVTDLSQHDQREAVLRQLVHVESERPFDLGEGPLFRAGLWRLGASEHVFYLNLHHIVSDGWSMMLLFRELSALYEAALSGATLAQRAPRLAELPIQYADYALWQREWLKGERLEEQLAYWRQQLADAPAVLELPTDHTRPTQQGHHGGTQKLNLDQELVRRVKQFSQASGCTVFMTLLAVFKVLLHRYTGQGDIVVGTPVAGRNRGELEGLIGFFINTLVLRTELADNPTFNELLQRVREVCLGAYGHQDLPFEKLVEELQPERSLSHSPIFQVMFSLLEIGPESFTFAGIETKEIELEREVTKFDLTLSFSEHDDGTFAGQLRYRDDLFAPDTIRRLAEQYLRALHAVLDHPAARVSEIELLDASERRRLLEEWIPIRDDVSPAQCVHTLFELQAERNPQAIAVKGETTALTYEELNRSANQLAHYLQTKGVGPEQRVAICLERSVEMVIALLAVLKTGAAYIPVNPEYPERRIAFILNEIAPRATLTSQHLLDRLPETEAVCLDSDWSLISRFDDHNLNGSVSDGNAAYIIYTSGSTGTAKGVLIEHRQLVSYVLAVSRILELEPGDRFGFLASFAADLSYTAIFPSLCTGGTLFVISPELGMDAMALSQYLRANPIDHLKIVPSHLRTLVESTPDGADIIPRKRLVLGGEASGWELIETLERLKPSCRIVNHYGPTETTVGVLTYDVRSSSRATRKAGVPLGRPLANAQAYILDRHLQLVPIRTPGELYIGGQCLARGYHARPDLTAQRFIPNPFSTTPGARLYRTGDVARHLPDGNIEFLGRSDQQVKIRGFRIEPGEIEAVLAEHPSVREAAVIVTDMASGDKRLVAHVVPQEPGELDLKELQSYLRQRLPEYMIPAALLPLKQMPLTASGKIDRQSLAVSGSAAPLTNREFVEPATPIEQVIASVFSQTLNVDRIGAQDNFFDLGGHSLLAMQVVSRLREMLHVEVPLRWLFEFPTVSQLATQILARESTTGQTEKIARIIMQVHLASSPPSN
jgi:amino acid adenylation domain-containing protein